MDARPSLPPNSKVPRQETSDFLREAAGVIQLSNFSHILRLQRDGQHADLKRMAHLGMRSLLTYRPSRYGILKEHGK